MSTSPIKYDSAELLQARLWVRMITPLGVIMLIAVVDVLAGRQAYLASLISVVPPLAAESAMKAIRVP